ncbi:flagellar biosynthesis regulator FlaF [Jannaschia ovalis]|uniref:Flagellar biosynthesis regulator FlaF n=1 Tax=Jannaschia ovalis TaxID=3038773 RepID=A0ABY8LFW5_9RHOB|nr:flagellar biosynthesis regulator FlaF [Jannaschia sp. GRR-S6-38]WGH80187.1 flagellar biosynthesis regulator FlaF [Jannaschia sp. GRR-S6-38]
MGFPQTATAAYGALEPALVDPSRAEALVFARVTRALEAAFATADASAADRARALHDNRRLWLAAAAACADDANALAPDLRAALISLAGFVERHSSTVLRGQAGPEPLIEINRRVAGGLTRGAS